MRTSPSFTVSCTGTRKGVTIRTFGGPIYITSSGAAIIDVHEQGHIDESRRIYNLTIALAESAVSAYTYPGLLRFGATLKDCYAELGARIKWDARIADFIQEDTRVNDYQGTYHAGDDPLRRIRRSFGWSPGPGIEYLAGQYLYQRSMGLRWPDFRKIKSADA